MASPLTIITSIVGAAAGRSHAASGGQQQTGGTDIFGALVGSTDQGSQSNAARSSESQTSLRLGNGVRMSLGFGGDGAMERNETPEAIAAAVEGLLPIQQSTKMIGELTSLVSDLGEMKANLANGEPVAPDLLKRIDAALAQLADDLGIDLAATKNAGELAAIVTDLLPDDTKLQARLTTALTPLAEALLTNGEDADAGPLPDAIKAIGDKMSALIAALNNGDVSADRLAQLDLAAEGDPALNAALLKLANPVIKIDATPAGAVLATPQLELTEPVLTGKAAPDAPPVTQKVAEADASDATPTLKLQATDASNSEKSGGNSQQEEPAKPIATRPAPAAASAAPVSDDKIEAQPAVTMLPTARVDAVAGPRVVQAGYQTSQQQLNLPQLAFEMVRQVGEGNTRFQLRLDPAELGKIDVRIDIDKSGQVNARLTVEKSETLDLMQRDQRALERALQQAGLDGAKPNLEFSLKQNPFGSGQQGQDANGNASLFGKQTSAEAEEPALPTINLYRGNLSASGVNIIA